MRHFVIRLQELELVIGHMESRKHTHTDRETDVEVEIVI